MGAGVINLDLTRAAEPHGLHFARTRLRKSACTIGGNVANNPGGAHCLAEGARTAQMRFGHTDLRITLRIYAQAITEADRSAAERLGHRFLGKGTDGPALGR